MDSSNILELLLKYIPKLLSEEDREQFEKDVKMIEYSEWEQRMGDDL
jgi:hypothetical protein